jgi:hypothetical protein
MISIKLKKIIIVATMITLVIAVISIVAVEDETINDSKDSISKTFVKFDNTQSNNWGDDFRIVEIKSQMDKHLQKAYFYKSTSGKPEPLIVSLHTWSGDYAQKDDLAKICKQKNINYIHPDFRGPNRTKNACCSELAMYDIDNAISFALKNSNVAPNKIYVIGVSGGGYATLSTFMKSKHQIRKFSAWASISDLVAWYNESSLRKNKYAQEIMDCTASENVLDIDIAKSRSPLFWETPREKLSNSELSIYAGVYDGIQGSVPISHSINFYNKLLMDLGVKDATKYVSSKEHLSLLELRSPLGHYGNISDRIICLKKKSGNLSLTIFEGDHEMLTGYALDALIQD